MGRASLRQSTQAKAAAGASARKAEQAAAERNRARLEKLRRARGADTATKVLTQEEMLLEAVATETENRRQLRLMMSEQAARRRAPAAVAARRKGPSVRFHSKKGQTNRLSFSDHFDEVPSVINQPGTRYRRRCVVSARLIFAISFVCGRPTHTLFGSTHPLFGCALAFGRAKHGRPFSVTAFSVLLIIVPLRHG
jgi:hypothetical protein